MENLDFMSEFERIQQLHHFGDVKKNTFLHFNTIHFFENDFLSYFCCIIQINFIYLGVNEPFTSKNRKKKL